MKQPGADVGSVGGRINAPTQKHAAQTLRERVGLLGGSALSRARRHAVFSSWMMAFLLLTLAGGYMLWQKWRRSDAVHLQLARTMDEFLALSHRSPALTPELNTALEAQLARSRSRLKEVIAQLSRGRGERVNPPDRMHRADVFFEIAAFVERMRDHADRCGVELKPQERFGFGANTPGTEDVAGAAAVLEERLAAEVLLTTLFDAQPQTFIALERERSVSAVHGSTPESGMAANLRGDYFEWNLKSSARVAGAIEAVALRVAFTGQTGNLRAFLNALAAHDLPLLVREVDVAPVLASAADRRDQPSKFRVQPALVPQRSSRFTVTVELIRPVEQHISEG
jgi:hypothetical protein